MAMIDRFVCIRSQSAVPRPGWRRSELALTTSAYCRTDLTVCTQTCSGPVATAPNTQTNCGELPASILTHSFGALGLSADLLLVVVRFAALASVTGHAQCSFSPDTLSIECSFGGGVSTDAGGVLDDQLALPLGESLVACLNSTSALCFLTALCLLVSGVVNMARRFPCAQLLRVSLFSFQLSSPCVTWLWSVRARSLARIPSATGNRWVERSTTASSSPSATTTESDRVRLSSAPASLPTAAFGLTAVVLLCRPRRPSSALAPGQLHANRQVSANCLLRLSFQQTTNLLRLVVRRTSGIAAPLFANSALVIRDPPVTEPLRLFAALCSEAPANLDSFSLEGFDSGSGGATPRARRRRWLQRARSGRHSGESVGLAIVHVTSLCLKRLAEVQLACRASIAAKWTSAWSPSANGRRTIRFACKTSSNPCA